MPKLAISKKQSACLLLSATQHHISGESAINIIIIIILSSTLRPPKLYLPFFLSSSFLCPPSPFLPPPSPLPPASNLRIWCYKPSPVFRNFKTHLSSYFWLFPHFSARCDYISMLTLVAYYSALHLCAISNLIDILLILLSCFQHSVDVLFLHSIFCLDKFTPSCDIRNPVNASSILPVPCHPLTFSHNPSFTLKL